MKYTITLLLLVIVWIASLFPATVCAQITDTTLLCRGAFFTEAEGKASLEKFATTYHDKRTWEKRATRIRQTIINGAGLHRFPQNTPLKPIVNSKRAYNGYSVENVSFESLPGFFVTGNLYRPAESHN
ncbi:MAG: acetylxylan esterase, partial [Bacteroidota bacterium]|nr:acetylxylan esterase [Bacteroidota bacterium]